MKLGKIIHQHFRTVALGGLLLAAGSAHAISITSKHTGSWFNPNQDGQGFAIEVVPGATANEKQAVVYWYTFDAAGNPTWYFGAGTIQDNMASVTLYRAEGGTMGEAGTANKQEWGSMQLDFSSCDHGEITYQSAQASGAFTIERITQVFGDVCTGTLVDDVSDDQTTSESIRQALYATGGQGSGSAELEISPNYSEFSIEVYDLAEGSYDIEVGGTVRGQIDVISMGAGTRGEMKFVSPQDNSHPLLDFDPRGMEILIKAAGETLLSSTMPSDTPADDSETNPSGAPDFGNSSLEVYLDRLTTDAAFDNAYAKAELEQNPSSVQFEVKLENAPSGAYELYVDGTLRGAIEVVDLGNVTKGKLKFYYPEIAGYEVLDFDPTGATVTIMDANGALFEGYMDPAAIRQEDSGHEDDDGQCDASDDTDGSMDSTGSDSDCDDSDHQDDSDHDDSSGDNDDGTHDDDDQDDDDHEDDDGDDDHDGDRDDDDDDHEDDDDD